MGTKTVHIQKVAANDYKVVDASVRIAGQDCIRWVAPQDSGMIIFFLDRWGSRYAPFGEARIGPIEAGCTVMSPFPHCATPTGTYEYLVYLTDLDVLARGNTPPKIIYGERAIAVRATASLNSSSANIRGFIAMRVGSCADGCCDPEDERFYEWLLDGEPALNRSGEPLSGRKVGTIEILRDGTHTITLRHALFPEEKDEVTVEVTGAEQQEPLE